MARGFCSPSFQCHPGSFSHFAREQGRPGLPHRPHRPYVRTQGLNFPRELPGPMGAALPRVQAQLGAHWVFGRPRAGRGGGCRDTASTASTAPTAPRCSSPGRPLRAAGPARVVAAAGRRAWPGGMVSLLGDLHLFMPSLLVEGQLRAVPWRSRVLMLMRRTCRAVVFSFLKTSEPSGSRSGLLVSLCWENLSSTVWPGLVRGDRQAGKSWARGVPLIPALDSRTN